MNTIDITKTISMALSEVMTSEGIVKKTSRVYKKYHWNFIRTSTQKVEQNCTLRYKKLDKMLLSLNNSLSNFFLKVKINEYQKVQAKLLLNGVN